MHFYETDQVRLFDLSKDIGEQSDLATERPEKAADLKDRLERYLKSVNARMPAPNPDHDPSKAPADRRGRKSKGGKANRRRDRNTLGFR